MNYYILWPDQNKNKIDYDKQLAAYSGTRTIFFKEIYINTVNLLTHYGESQFTQMVCSPEEIIIFDEKGNEWNMIKFIDYIDKKYKNLKKDK